MAFVVSHSELDRRALPGAANLHLARGAGRLGYEPIEGRVVVARVVVEARKPLRADELGKATSLDRGTVPPTDPILTLA